MGHQYDPRKHRPYQLVTLLAIDVPILRSDSKGIVECETCEAKVDAVFGTIEAILTLIPIEAHPYIHFSIHEEAEAP